MIPATMAVAAASAQTTSGRYVYAREARVARSAALVLDAIVFGFVTAVVNGVYGVTEITSASFSPSGSVMSTTTSVAWPWLTLLGLLYFTIPEAMFGASLGKHWMHLKVVRLDGLPLGLGAVIIRNLLKPIDFLPLLYLVGGVLVLLTPGAQRLGDMAGGTTVVYQRRAPEAGATRTSGRMAARRVLPGVLLAALLFTALFDYFGRPPLLIDGLFKQDALLARDLRSYELGAPTWGFGRVTYPIRGRTATAVCSGSIHLQWQFLGWTESSGSMTCDSS